MTASDVPSLQTLISGTELETILVACGFPDDQWVCVHDSAGQTIASWSAPPASDTARHVLPLRVAGEQVGDMSFDAACRLERAQAVRSLVEMVLKRAYATFATSHVHLLVSQTHASELVQQNAELQRAVEHLRHLDALKSNFLATMSHELRTPLTSIIGFSELLLDTAESLSNDERSFVAAILGRGQELLALITRVLELSELESGAGALQLEEVGTDELVQKAAAMWMSHALRIDIAASLPHVMVDRARITWVIGQLCENAVRFSDAPSQLEIIADLAPLQRPLQGESRFGGEPHDAVRISIADRGKGIANEDLEQIFEPFHQLDQSSTREQGGAGIGLTLVRKIARAHGGDAWAELRQGGGCVFHVTLPIANSSHVP